VPGPGGCFVARLPAGSGGGWLRLYRWIDGVPVDLADAGAAARAGGLLGRLHACALASRGEADPWYDTVHDGKPDAAAVRRTLAAYQAAGGPGRIRDEQSFAMLIACTLNFPHTQASVALDPNTESTDRRIKRWPPTARLDRSGP
jgi:hypothetical protein